MSAITTVRPPQAQQAVTTDKRQIAAEHSLHELVRLKEDPRLQIALNLLTKEDRPVTVGLACNNTSVGYSVVTRKLVEAISHVGDLAFQILKGGDFGYRELDRTLGSRKIHFECTLTEFTTAFTLLGNAIARAKSPIALYDEVNARVSAIPLDPDHTEYRGQKMLDTDPALIEYWNSILTDANGQIVPERYPRIAALVNQTYEVAKEVKKELETLLPS